MTEPGQRSAPGLVEGEAALRLFVESVEDYAIFMLDPEGRIATWNRGAERIKGYRAEDVLGKHFSIFYTAKDVERRYPDFELKEASRTGRFEDEGWRVRKDGSRMWANVVITAVRDRGGRLIGFGKVTRDLTERRRTEEDRERLLARERESRRRAEELAANSRKQAARVEALNAELQVRTEEAESANRAKSDFLANMSHELRTPINAILGYAELLQMGVTGPVSDKQEAQLERIRTSSKHLLALIEDILDFSKIEVDRLEVGREEASLHDSLEAALGLAETQAAQQGLRIENDCGSDAPLRFLGDPDRVRQILANLLSNAVKFTDPGGHIRVRCGREDRPEPRGELEGEGPWICVRVEDTGTGVEPDLLEAIFAPFVQGETERSRSKGGAGLGLSISRRLARLMGGDLTVESEPGKGSRFALYLPMA